MTDQEKTLAEALEAADVKIAKGLSDFYQERKQQDMVNHPPHYAFGKHETIDVIEAWDLPYHLGNVVKYVSRAKRKGKELEDLKKAAWYLDRYIKVLEEEVEKKFGGSFDPDEDFYIGDIPDHSEQKHKDYKAPKSQIDIHFPRSKSERTVFSLPYDREKQVEIKKLNDDTKPFGNRQKRLF